MVGVGLSLSVVIAVIQVQLTLRRALNGIHRNLQRHRAVSLRKHGFLVLKALRQSRASDGYVRYVQSSSTSTESSSSSSSSSTSSCRDLSSSQIADTEHHQRTSMTSLMTSLMTLMMTSAGVRHRRGLVTMLLKVALSACF